MKVIACSFRGKYADNHKENSTGVEEEVVTDENTK